jgi:hypothetical protein
VGGEDSADDPAGGEETAGAKGEEGSFVAALLRMTAKGVRRDRPWRFPVGCFSFSARVATREKALQRLNRLRKEAKICSSRAKALLMPGLYVGAEAPTP